MAAHADRLLTVASGWYISSGQLPWMMLGSYPAREDGSAPGHLPSGAIHLATTAGEGVPYMYPLLHGTDVTTCCINEAGSGFCCCDACRGSCSVSASTWPAVKRCHSVVVMERLHTPTVQQLRDVAANPVPDRTSYWADTLSSIPVRRQLEYSANTCRLAAIRLLFHVAASWQVCVAAVSLMQWLCMLYSSVNGTAVGTVRHLQGDGNTG